MDMPSTAVHKNYANMIDNKNQPKKFSSRNETIVAFCCASWFMTGSLYIMNYCFAHTTA